MAEQDLTVPLVAKSEMMAAVVSSPVVEVVTEELTAQLVVARNVAQFNSDCRDPSQGPTAGWGQALGISQWARPTVAVPPPNLKSSDEDRHGHIALMSAGLGGVQQNPRINLSGEAKRAAYLTWDLKQGWMGDMGMGQPKN